MLHHILATFNTRDTHLKSIHETVGQKPNSSFETKAFSAPIKIDKTMGPYYLHEGEKNKSKNQKKNWGQRAKRKESCKAYPCIGSSPMIQQQGICKLEWNTFVSIMEFILEFFIVYYLHVKNIKFCTYKVTHLFYKIIPHVTIAQLKFQFL